MGAGHETFTEIWYGLEGILRSEQFGLTEVAGLRTACTRFLLERLDPSNTVLRALSKSISDLFDAALPNTTPIDSIRTLFEMVDDGLPQLSDIARETIEPNTIKAAAMVIAHERAKL